MNGWEFALSCLMAYATGSISFSYFITLHKAGVDLRSVGSGNLGATNAGRVLGRRWAVAIYFLDFFKGYGSVFLPGLVFGEEYFGSMPIRVAAGVAVMLGHIFPFYLKFKGGKGVATGSGAVVALSWMTGAVAFVIWYVLLKLTRVVSIASIVSTMSLVVIYLSLDRSVGRTAWYAGFFVTAALLVVLMHRKNIVRIFAGTEPRVGEKS